MSLNEAIIKARVELQNSKVKKSGTNKYAGFKYYELADFLPTLNTIMETGGINDIFTIEEGYAKLTLVKGEEKQSYSMPFVMFDTPLNNSGKPSMQQIQYLGALNTYYKRYLYLNAFGITDGEVIDAMDNKELTKAPHIPTKAEKYVQFKEILKKASIEEINFMEYLKDKGITLGVIIDKFITDTKVQNTHLQECENFLMKDAK